MIILKNIMTINEITRALHELKLPGMAGCWDSLEETHQLDKLTLRENWIIESWENRKLHDLQEKNEIQVMEEQGRS